MLNNLKFLSRVVIAFLTISASNYAIANEAETARLKAPKTPKLEYSQLADIRKLATKIQKESFDEKILKISEFFIGKPYNFELADRLISWDRKRNKVKLVDFSSFDCLSFVEEVLALAKFDTVPVTNKEFLKDFSENLSSIMFAVNDVSYTGRNHFFDSEWIKSNSNLIAANAVEELPYAKTKVAKLDKKSLLENQLQNYANKYVKEENRSKFNNKFKDKLEKFETIESIVKYISFKDFIANKDELANKLKGKVYIFALVMDNPKLLELTRSEHNIGHVGFVYVKDGEFHLRHASSTGSKAVEDISLIEYAKLKETSETFPGFALYELK